MSISYEAVPNEQILCIRDLCNELMAYQKSKAHIHPEFFDTMCFETRIIPAVRSATANYLVVAKDNNEIVGYAYSNIAPKTVYSGGFATLQCDAFFDFDSVRFEEVGCLSQFFIKEGYRGRAIGGVLFDKSMEWLNSFEYIKDIFIFVSNGNEGALRFYQSKGFRISHQILDGFIIVLRNSVNETR